MLKCFLKELAKYCWLMTTATPPLRLKFDVAGKRFVDIKARFQDYYINIDQYDCNGGCVYRVVWPSLETDNGGIYCKGEAIVAPKRLGSPV